MWYGGSNRHQRLTYTAWAPGHPHYYDSMILVKYGGATPVYRWAGTFASSPRSNLYSYPFICEMKANSRCHTSPFSWSQSVVLKPPVVSRDLSPEVTFCFAAVTQVRSKTKGRNYRGNMDYTTQGITCQHWTAQYPHRHKTITGNRNVDVLRNGLGDHNYCRNPNSLRAKPWCYTTLTKTKWQYCDIHIVKPNPKREGKETQRQQQQQQQQ